MKEFETYKSLLYKIEQMVINIFMMFLNITL